MGFGTYEDAITTRSATLFHSTLSPLLNLGLLTPKEVVAATEDLFFLIWSRAAAIVRLGLLMLIPEFLSLPSAGHRLARVYPGCVRSTRLGDAPIQ